MYIEKNFLKHTCSWNIDINFFVISLYVQEACWLNCQFFWMVNIKVLNKTMLQICILPSFSTTIFLKTRGPCATSLTWKKTIPCNIPLCSICYYHFKLWIPFWGTSIGLLFMNGFKRIYIIWGSLHSSLTNCKSFASQENKI